MLLQIPSVSDAIDDKGRYKVFNVHINGSYHCSLRYSQLLAFHNELKVNHDVTSLEEFPPKRLLSLNDQQLETRRFTIERYLQSVCQDRVIIQSEFYTEFLLAAQVASCEVVEQSVDLEVFLVNGKSVTVQIATFEPSDQVLEKAASATELDKDLTYYFGLFLERQCDDGQSWSLVRSLQDYEYPHVSLEAARKLAPHRITFRRNFWDPKLMNHLLGDRTAKNLLYIEALLEVEEGHLQVPSASQSSLVAMQRKGMKKEYLELARTFPQFGYRQLDDISFDHPTPNLHGSIRIGPVEIVTFTRDGENMKPCGKYALTRMRCWKVGHRPVTGEHWLTFHYQLSKDQFVWVTLIGKRVPFANICLHSAVHELLRKRSQQDIRKPSAEPIKRKHQSLPRVKICPPPEKGHPNEEDLSSPTLQSPTGSFDSGRDEGERKESLSSRSYEATSNAERHASVTSNAERQPSVTSNEGRHPSTTSNEERHPSVTSNEEGESVAGGDSETVTTTRTSLTKAALPPGKRKGKKGDIENPTFEYGDDEDL